MSYQSDHIDLFAYKRWADDLLYTSLGNLSTEQLLAPRKMLFGNILALLNHVYAMDVAWCANLRSIAHGMESRNPQTALAFNELEKLQSNINSWYQEYATSLTGEQLSETVHFTFIGGGSGNMRRSEIFHHVINHATYHRGHIEGVMYQLSIEPPTTDIPVFIKLGK